MLLQNGQQSTPSFQPEQDPWDQMAWWEKSLDVLSRPNFASANLAKALLTGADPFKAMKRGITGEDRTTYSDVLAISGMDPGITRAVLGFAGDVLLDPTTYLTLGAGAGKSAVVGGVTKTLTKAGELAHAATVGEKTAQAGRILARGVETAESAKLTPELKALFPRELTQARYDKLLGTYGVTNLADGMPRELTAKVIGEEAGGRMIGRAIKGESVPAVADAFLKGQRGAVAVVKPTTLRFAGQPLIPAGVATRMAQAGQATLSAVEKLPVVGKVLGAAREAGQTIKAALGKAFSTSTGLPELDRILKRSADLLDSKTMATVRKYVDTYVKPLASLQKTNEGAYKTALEHIQTYLEGFTQIVKKEVPDAMKQAEIEQQIGRLSEVLGKIHARGAAEKEASAIDVLGRTLERQKAAGEIARQENKLALESHKANEAKLLRELRERGIRMNEGFGKEEFNANIPKAMRKKSGVPMDTMIGELVRRGHLPHGATESDLYRLIEKLQRKPRKLLAEDVIHNLPAVKGRPVSPYVEKAGKAIETRLAERQQALKNVPMISKPESVKLFGEEAVKAKFEVAAMDPRVKAMAESARQTFEDIWTAENKHLPLPPEKMKGYLPHYMKDEFRETLMDIIRSDSRNIMKPEFSAGMTEAQRRTWETTVDKATINQMIDGGHIDPSKAEALLKSRGLNPTADDLLVFETNPVQAALRRELASVRALSSVQMSQEVLASPYFTKARTVLGDTDKILATLSEHPGHALFVPTKDYIERFLTKAEKESLRRGAKDSLSHSMLREISQGELRELVKNPLKAGTPAYIIPKEVAEVLAKAHSFQFDEQAFRDAANLWDKATAWWKMSMTAARPGFHVRNALSNLWQMMSAGMRDPRQLYTAGLLMKDPAMVKNIGRFTGQEAYMLADRYGVLRSGGITSDINDLVKREIAPSKNPLSTTGPIARWGTKIGGTIEDNARLALFLDGLENGMDAASSAMRVKKYLFDYKDLTKTERTFFRRVIPFYSWSRKSIPLGLETLVTKPGIGAAIGKIGNEARANIDNPLENEYVSKFVREGLGIPVRKNTDGSTDFFLLNGWIPTVDVLKMNPQDMFAMLHPAIKTPIEQAINLNVFTGKPIERFGGELTKLGGVTMPARAAHVLRNIMYVTEVDRIISSPEKPMGELLLGLGTGIRSYKQDKVIQMRSDVFNLGDQINQLKSAVSIATKKYGGDSDIAQQAAAEMERLILQRDRVRDLLLSVDPTALSHAAPKERKQGAIQTFEQMRRSLSPKRLMNKTIHEALAPKKAIR